MFVALKASNKLIVLVLTLLVVWVKMTRVDSCLRSLPMGLLFLLVVLHFIVLISSRFLLPLKEVYFWTFYIVVR